MLCEQREQKYLAFFERGGVRGGENIFSREKRVSTPHKSSPLFGNSAFFYGVFRCRRKKIFSFFIIPLVISEIDDILRKQQDFVFFATVKPIYSGAGAAA